MTKEKSGKPRGRPKKAGGAMSATERSRRHRERQREIIERLKDELAYVEDVVGDLDDEANPVDGGESDLLADLDKVREDASILALLAAMLINELRHNRPAISAVFNMPDAVEALRRHGIMLKLPSWLHAEIPQPKVYSRDHHGGFAEEDVAGTLTTRTGSRLEELVVEQEDNDRDSCNQKS